MLERRATPALGDETARSSASSDLGLAEVRELAKDLVRDARRIVSRLRLEQSSLEEELRLRREAFEAELAERRATLEKELAEHRAELEAAALESARSRVEKEAARALHEGFERGLTEGRETGRVEARDEESERIEVHARRLEQLVTQVAAELGARKRELLAGARRELLGLALEIGRRVIKREIRDDACETVVANLRAAIDLIVVQQKLIVQVSAEDLELVQGSLDTVRGALSEADDLEICAAEDIERGGCRVVSGTGAVDLCIETQLAEIERALLGDHSGTGSACHHGGGRASE